MRILQVADFYWPHLGGVEQHVRTLGRGLAAVGHDVHVATVRTGELPAVERDGDVVVHRLHTTSGRVASLFASSERPWAPPVPDPEAVVGLRRLVTEIRPDVVHGHDWLARSYLPLARWAKRRFGTRYVSTQHYYTLSCAKKDLMTSTSSWTTSTGAIGPCVGPSLARCISCSRRHYGAARGAVTLVGNRVGARMESALVDEMVAVSSATAIGNGLDVDDVTIIGNPVAQSHLDTTEMARVRRLPERFVLFVGDLRPMKGIDVLFDAHRRLWSDRPHQPPLVVIGKRWPDTPTDIPDGVHVFERWPNAAVLAAWERALIGVVPSVWEEPFGIVAVEALRAGTPVVASRVGGLPEIVRDGVDGLLVPRSDAIALADAVASLVDDEPRRRAMSAAARARARDFDMGVIVDDVAALYQRPPERR